MWDQKKNIATIETTIMNLPQYKLECCDCRSTVYVEVLALYPNPHATFTYGIPKFCTMCGATSSDGTAPSLIVTEHLAKQLL